jgi:hypothetical protein
VIRSALYVDGLNLYHAIDGLNEPFLKWLNLWELGRALIQKQTETLVRVVTCTAYFPNDERKRWRHGEYNKALAIAGVHCEMGHHTYEDVYCRVCDRKWQKPIEKQSDINVALHLYSDAVRDVFDKAYLLTADSDQASTARFLREHFPQKQLITVAPPGRNYSVHILSYAYGRTGITKELLEKCLFPQIVLGTDKPSARRPREYDPPSWWVHPNDRPQNGAVRTPLHQ